MTKRASIESYVRETIEKVRRMPKDEHLWAEKIPTRDFARFGRHGDDFLLLLPSLKIRHQAPVFLENLSVNYGVNCQVSENGVTTNETLTILKFKSVNDDLIDTIGDIVSLLLRRIPRYKEDELAGLIHQLIDLFRHLNDVPDSTMIGLWGELLVILQSNNPTEVARSWHATPLDRFDFSHENLRLEVKTTTGPRQHSFGWEQLLESDETQIVIASVILTEDQNGMNVFELVHRVVDQVSDKSVIQKILNIASKTIGQNQEGNSYRRFNLTSAEVNLRFYRSSIVPKPLPPPPGVFQLRFKSDLQLSPPTSKIELTTMGELGKWLG